MCLREGTGWSAIPKIRIAVALAALGLAASGSVCAQTAPVGPVDQVGQVGQSALSTPALEPASLSAPAPAAILPDAPQPLAPGPYVQPTQDQKFHSFVSNAVGPVAFAGAAMAGAIDQMFDFPSRWGQGLEGYGPRVASNLGISMVTATSQYGIAEVFREDTAYYRCTCSGMLPRLWHAALGSVTSHRGSDGHIEFSPALTVSPFIGPMVAANTWIPSHDGPRLGFHMGEHNLLGQLAQDEALEFVYGGPNTLLGHIQRRFLKSSRNRQ
jgi:hypothetical protein